MSHLILTAVLILTTRPVMSVATQGNPVRTASQPRFTLGVCLMEPTVITTVYRLPSVSSSSASMDSTNPRLYSTAVFKKSAYKRTHVVQACIVRESTVYIF